ncbi:MAG TPA: alpha/beta hydrolase-fold protein [Candidatus Sulfotelmatobacter sp.]|jgi:enterochelin esterase-like enzyme|nr:alpha/beta hydrolase-fold protein [Candidatus Sulfotelmatobacter sp.]
MVQANIPPMGRIQTIRNGAAPSAAMRARGATGDLRLHEFQSRVFRNTRFLRVWLPPNYDDAENSGRRYPVLYLNDGQNLFEAASSYAGVEWQVDETADRLIREGGVPPMIIVGIDHAGKDRIREYMPHRSMNPMMLRVQGRYYPDFLIKEVMPFVGRNYRVAAGPENTGLGGSSLGALIALYTAMVRPGVIGRLLVESPSLWVSHRQTIKESRSVRIWPERIYLGVGTAEAGSAERSRSVVDDVRELAAILRRAVLSEKRLRLVIQDGAGHNEAAWAERFPEALRFLYGQ